MIREFELCIDIDEDTDDVSIFGFEEANLKDFEALISELIWQYRNV